MYPNQDAVVVLGDAAESALGTDDNDLPVSRRLARVHGRVVDLYALGFGIVTG